ncbi:hypothetical protein C1638_000845 [Chryseobacterium oncorhynchi]|uniref:Uncharacterized protein n=1 Tax=Chryseobacterium oncorhynchi TaxID=741074 RepID=A0A316X337_9FLAO|nr:hypothetical protein C1638_000845 [Chryseobacterium oncorhynchi]
MFNRGFTESLMIKFSTALKRAVFYFSTEHIYKFKNQTITSICAAKTTIIFKINKATKLH